MTRKAFIFIIIILPLCCIEKIIGAETAKLIDVSGFKNDQISRIFFKLDRIPEFKVENSGHRIRVILEQTSIDLSLSKMPQDEFIFQIETSETNKASIIDLFARYIPKFVDVSVDRQNILLIVSIFWNQKGLDGKVAISDQRFGELKTTNEGSTGQKFISSEYAGRWIDFFREYEWPVIISLPINFTFPEFPSPLIFDNEQILPLELLKADSKSMCDRIEKTLSENIADLPLNKEKLLYDLFAVECLLRQDDSARAMDILNREREESFNEPESLWRQYFQAYAHAISGRYFRACSFLKGIKDEHLNSNSFAQWYLILRAELELAKGSPDSVLELLNSETEIEGHLGWLYNLRKADTFYQLGLIDDAQAAYKNVVTDPNLLKKYPHSLANLADVQYQKKEYSKAFGHYFILSEILSNEYQHQKSLSEYRSAMSKLRSGEKEQARFIFEKIINNAEKTEAGFRSMLKMIDLDLLNDSKPVLGHLISSYDEIIENAPIRNIREEAFFKKILACHLYGDDCRAVKLLGRFFENYRAGNLQTEAKAFFAEIFPKVIEKLVDQDAYLIALSLTAKYREILAQAHITYDFLFNLAKSYSKAGFLDQAEATYLFMLDYEKNKENKSSVFLSLIELYHQKGKSGQVQKYASQYLKENSGGKYRAEVLYYYADALFKIGDVASAVSLLLDKNRPNTKQLDILAGDIFFELGKYDLVEYYLSRAAAEDPNKIDHKITLKRAEAYFFNKKLHNAIPLYESLLDIPQFTGQAGYRLILISYELTCGV